MFPAICGSADMLVLPFVACWAQTQCIFCWSFVIYCKSPSLRDILRWKRIFQKHSLRNAECCLRISSDRDEGMGLCNLVSAKHTLAYAYGRSFLHRVSEFTVLSRLSYERVMEMWDLCKSYELLHGQQPEGFEALQSYLYAQFLQLAYGREHQVPTLQPVFERESWTVDYF